ATTRLAINVPLAPSEISRGDLVTSDVELEPTSAIDGVFRGDGVRRGASLVLHAGGTRVAVRVTRVDGPIVSLRFASPRPIVGGDRFLLRGASTASRDGARIVDALIREASPRPVVPRALHGRFVIDDAALARAMSQREDLVRCGD